MSRSQQNEIRARVREAYAELQKAVNSPPIKELTAPIEKELGLDQKQSHLRYLLLKENIEDLARHAALADPEALTELRKDVKSLPIKELTALIERELRLGQEQAHQSDIRYLRLEEDIDGLAEHAALADPEAIRELHYLGRFIQDRLSDIDRPSRCVPKQDSLESNESDSGAEGDLPGNSAQGCSSVNEAADRLCGILEEGDERLRKSLGKVVRRLPSPHFSFPLENLLGFDAPPTGALALLSEICDRLIEKRLKSARSRVLRELKAPAEPPTDWPAGWNAKSRKKERPTSLVRTIFFALDGERRRFRSEAERSKLEEEAEKWLSLLHYLKKIEKVRKAHQDRSDSDQSELVVDDLPWPLARHKEWRDRAALLPPLRSDNATIGKWVGAGLFWVVAQHDGSLKEAGWVDAIMSRMDYRESFLGGLKLFLIEGFETLAGKDQKAKRP